MRTALSIVGCAVALSLGALAPVEAHGACSVKVKLKNNSLEETYVLSARVRGKEGGWSALGSGRSAPRIGPGGNQVVRFEVPGACTAQRRFEFTIDVVGHGERTTYTYPTTTGWTSSTTLDLGDLSRFFWQLSQE